MKKVYKMGNISPALVIFLDKMNKFNYEFLTKIVVDTKDKKVNLSSGRLFCSLDCEIGINGSVLYKNSKKNDGKTPICSTKVRHIDMPNVGINNPNSAVFTKTIKPSTNLGPCFICLYITIPKTDKIRGIGFHGSYDDSLLPTNGCIRLHNADLYAIRKLFFKNLKVLIR